MIFDSKTSREPLMSDGSLRPSSEAPEAVFPHFPPFAVERAAGRQACLAVPSSEVCRQTAGDGTARRDLGILSLRTRSGTMTSTSFGEEKEGFSETLVSLSWYKSRDQNQSGLGPDGERGKAQDGKEVPSIRLTTVVCTVVRTGIHEECPKPWGVRIEGEVHIGSGS